MQLLIGCSLYNKNFGDIDTMKVYPKHPSLLSEGVLKGDKVINHDGEELGKIEDFLIDTKAGKWSMLSSLSAAP